MYLIYRSTFLKPIIENLQFSLFIKIDLPLHIL